MGCVFNTNFKIILVLLTAAVGFAVSLVFRSVVVPFANDTSSVSLNVLLLYRLLNTLLGWFTLIHLYFEIPGEFVYKDPDGVVSKIRCWKLERFSTFTPQAFSFFSVYFTLSCVVTFCDVLQFEAPNWLRMLTSIVFEVALTQALIVSTVVTYVLYPQAVKHADVMEELIRRQFEWAPLVMHCLNTYALVVDICLHVRESHFTLFGFPLLYFCSYAVFSWYWYQRTNVFYYFFLNPKWKLSPIAYAGLLFFACVVSLGTIYLRNNASVAVLRVIFLAIAFFICRFRDTFERPKKKKT